MARRLTFDRIVKVVVFFAIFFTSGVIFGEGDSGWEEAPLFRSGDLTSVKHRLKKDPMFCPKCMFSAIQSGNLEVVKYLDSRGWLEESRKPEWIHAYGNPVEITAFFGSVEVLRYLLSRGFPADVKTMGHAVDHGQFDQVAFLCMHGINPDEKIPDKVNASLGSVSVIKQAKWTLSTTSGSNASDIIENARHYAGMAKAVDYIESGQCKTAPVRVTNPDESYKSEIAALRRGDLNTARKFLSQRDTAKDNPHVQVYELYEAVSSGNVELLRYLNGLGWLERCRALNHCYPLHVAAQKGVDTRVLAFLVSERFGVNTYNGLGFTSSRSVVDQAVGNTPVQVATLAGQLDSVKYLCQQGANDGMPVRTNKETTLLWELAVHYGFAWCGLKYGKYDVCAGEGNYLPCVPGAICGGIKFPPPGPSTGVKHVVALNDIFQYLKDGHCKNAQTEECRTHLETEGMVVGDKVNLREAPDAASKILITMGFGAPVKVLEKSKSCSSVAGRTGRWIKVLMYYPGYENDNQQGKKRKGEGWVFDTYINYLPRPHL